MKKYNKDELRELSELVKGRNMDGLRSFVGNTLAKVGKQAVTNALNGDATNLDYGVQGMKWGHHKENQETSKSSRTAKGSTTSFSSEGKKMAQKNTDMESELADYGIVTETAHDEAGARKQLADIISDGGKEFVVKADGGESKYPMTMDGYAQAYNDYADCLLMELEHGKKNGESSVDLSGIKFGANYSDGDYADMEEVDSGDIPEDDAIYPEFGKRKEKCSMDIKEMNELIRSLKQKYGISSETNLDYGVKGMKWGQRKARISTKGTRLSTKGKDTLSKIHEYFGIDKYLGDRGIHLNTDLSEKGLSKVAKSLKEKGVTQICIECGSSQDEREKNEEYAYPATADGLAEAFYEFSDELNSHIDGLEDGSAWDYDVYEGLTFNDSMYDFSGWGIVGFSDDGKKTTIENIGEQGGNEWGEDQIEQEYKAQEENEMHDKYGDFWWLK